MSTSPNSNLQPCFPGKRELLSEFSFDRDSTAAATSDVEVTNTTTAAFLSALEAQRLIDSSYPASPGVTTVPLICETSSETSIVMMKFADQEGEGVKGLKYRKVSERENDSMLLCTTQIR
jgi:hypothetical protein